MVAKILLADKIMLIIGTSFRCFHAYVREGHTQRRIINLNHHLTGKKGASLGVCHNHVIIAIY